MFSQLLEKQIYFLTECALAAGSSAYWRFSLCGLNCYGCCLWRCYDKCEGQARRKMYGSLICSVSEYVIGL